MCVILGRKTGMLFMGCERREKTVGIIGRNFPRKSLLVVVA